MPTGDPGSPDVRANTMSWVAWCSPELKRFCPLMTHSSPSRDRRSSRGRSRREPWFGSVSPNASRRRAVEEAGHPLGSLLVGAEVAHHQHRREVADDRALVLQVVVQAEALRRQVLADDRHLEVARRRGRRTRPAARSAASRRRRPAGASRPAAPPSPAGARRRSRSRCGRTRAGGRRTGCCRPACSSGMISRLDERVERVERRLDVRRDLEVHGPPPGVLAWSTP